MKSQKIISLNPNKNYQIIGEVPISTNEEIAHKVNTARIAQPLWAALELKKRIELLENLYTQFSQRKNEIGSIISREMGMPASVRNQIDLDAGLKYMRGYLDFAQEWLAPEVTFEDDKEIHYVFFEPKGIVGISIPWNYPFCNFVWSVIQNLVVGNAVVFKHSEECPLTGKLIEDIILSSSLPHGIFHEIYGDGYSVGEVLMNSEIDFIYFTGSTRVGKHLYQVAAKKFIPAMLELGGSAPGIVFKDANLHLAVESIYFNRFVNCGQTCDGLKRLIVHKSCFDELVQKLRSYVLTKKIGDAEDLKTDLGPLVAERQLSALEAQVDDAVKKGAIVITGGKRPAGLSGAYYEPTILTNVTQDMKVWREEVFGPVLPIISFDSEDQAIALANDTQYGLGGYIYTQDNKLAIHAASLLKTGNISINGVSFEIPQDPFGGYKNSGIGREHGKIGLKELCNVKTLAIKK